MDALATAAATHSGSRRIPSARVAMERDMVDQRRSAVDADIDQLQGHYEDEDVKKFDPKYDSKYEMQAGPYEEEYVEEILDDDEIMVDDDGMMEHEEVVYETIDNSAQGLETLMSMSRGSRHAHKTVREFLGEVGATEEVQSTPVYGSRKQDQMGGVRIQASARLLPVATMHKVGPQSYIMNKESYAARMRDWREEQRRDLEVCDFYDSLPADRQIAYRKLLERLGERIPKPIQGTRKFFRSTLAPHVKIPIPSNSKLELLSEHARDNVRYRYITKDTEFVRQEGELFYGDNGMKIYVYNGVHYVDRQAGDRGMDVVNEEIVTDEGFEKPFVMDEGEPGETDQQGPGEMDMTGGEGREGGEVQASNQNAEGGERGEGESDDEVPAPLEPAFQPGDPQERPPVMHVEDEEIMPILDKQALSMLSTKPNLNVTTRSLNDRWFVVPEMRKELIGRTHVQVSRGSIEQTEHFFCESCHEYLPRGMYEAHLRKLQKYGVCIYSAPRRFSCTEAGCLQKLANIEKLCTHLRISHKLPLEIKERTFSSDHQFQEFLRDLECKGGNFRMSRGNKSSPHGIDVRYYRCNRNVRLTKKQRDLAEKDKMHNLYGSEDDSEFDENEENINNEDGKKTRNKRSKLYIEGVCTAFFKKMLFPDGRVHIRYCDYHLHTDVVLRLPEDVRMRVRELNMKRLPVPVIIKIVKYEASMYADEGSNLEQRILDLSDKDVRNILTKADMKPVRLHLCRTAKFENDPDLRRMAGGAEHNILSQPPVYTETVQTSDKHMCASKDGFETSFASTVDVVGEPSDGSQHRSQPEPTPVPEEMIDHETIALEDQMLEDALNTRCEYELNPNRPPSPGQLTELEKKMFEEWQQEDLETTLEGNKRRRESLLLRRRREDAQNAFDEVINHIRLEFFESLDHDGLEKLENLIDELTDMYNATREVQKEVRKRLQSRRTRNRKRSSIASKEMQNRRSRRTQERHLLDEDDDVEEGDGGEVPQLEPEGLDMSDGEGEMSDELGEPMQLEPQPPIVQLNVRRLVVKEPTIKPALRQKDPPPHRGRRGIPLVEKEEKDAPVMQRVQEQREVNAGVSDDAATEQPVEEPMAEVEQEAEHVEEAETTEEGVTERVGRMRSHSERNMEKPAGSESPKKGRRRAATATEIQPQSTPTSPSPARGRGRSRKVKTEPEEVPEGDGEKGKASDSEPTTKQNKRVSQVAEVEEGGSKPVETPPTKKRGRGRPPKNRSANTTVVDEEESVRGGEADTSTGLDSDGELMSEEGEVRDEAEKPRAKRSRKEEVKGSYGYTPVQSSMSTSRTGRRVTKTKILDL